MKHSYKNLMNDRGGQDILKMYGIRSPEKANTSINDLLSDLDSKYPVLNDIEVMIVICVFLERYHAKKEKDVHGTEYYSSRKGISHISQFAENNISKFFDFEKTMLIRIKRFKIFGFLKDIFYAEGDVYNFLTHEDFKRIISTEIIDYDGEHNRYQITEDAHKKLFNYFFPFHQS